MADIVQMVLIFAVQFIIASVVGVGFAILALTIMRKVFKMPEPPRESVDEWWDRMADSRKKAREWADSKGYK